MANEKINNNQISEINFDEKKISVIIPVYNTETYLKECLDSVINQTLREIEIICIDDGSTDNSLQILEHYLKIDNRIKILSQKNKGAGFARNTGINSAKGEFVCFLDSDDYYQFNNNLELLYTKAKANNAKICGGAFSHLRNEEIYINTKDSFYGYGFEKEGFIDYKNWQFDYGYHRFLYNREFLIKNNLFFPNYKRFQDPPFFVKTMLCAEKFYAIPQSTYLFRFGHKKTSWNNQKQYDLLKGLSYNLKFAKKNKLNKLYYLTCERLNQHYQVFENQKLSPLVFFKLFKLLYSIDTNIIHKTNPNFQFTPYLKKINRYL